MNIVTITGNLGKDPEYRESNTNVCKFTVAVTDGYGEKQTTSWIPVVCFGKTADNCSKFLRKGSKVAVVGRIQTGSYEKDGRKVYTTDVIADKVEFLSAKSDEPQGFSRLTNDDVPF